MIPRAQIDALRFEDLVDQGIAAGDLAVLRQAIGLWAEPLPEMANEPVVVDAVARWHGLLGAALEGAADLHLRAGDAAAADQLLAPHLAAFPLRERLAALAALALYRTGRQVDALRVVDRARAALADTAGLDLGTELADPRTPDARSVACARPRAFVVSRLRSSGDATSSPRLHRAVARLGERRGGIATVTGPSGIGKTALVEELTIALERQGVSVAWARCPEGAAVPPFWPLTRVGLLDADAVTASDPFAHAQQIAREAMQRPSSRVLVIDDLQWADTDTLRVLTHLAAELQTHRDVADHDLTTARLRLGPRPGRLPRLSSRASG